MKTFLANLLSLLLLAAHTLAATSGTPCLRQGRPACCGCDCGDGACCMAKGSPRPQSAPAAPAPSISQNQLLLLLPASLVAQVPVALVVSELPARFPAAEVEGPVPLFCRNCSFLI